MQRILSPVPAAVGQILKGATGSYRLTKRIDPPEAPSILFKATRVPSIWTNSISLLFPRLAPPQQVAIKFAISDHKESYKCLKREYDAYRIPSIAESPDIRKMVDFIGDPEDLKNEHCVDSPAMVFEWFQCTLRHLRVDICGDNPVFVCDVVKPVLRALDLLAKEGKIHSDLKPDNIFLSVPDASRAIVKLGDLGSVHDDGYKHEAQPFAMRAPEVFQGIGCFHSSDVWSLALTIFVWLNGHVFGNWGNKFGHDPAAWSVAKLMLLFPGWKGSPVDRAEVRRRFELAERILIEDHPGHAGQKLLNMRTFETELEELNVIPEVRVLLSYLMVLNHKRRPTAAEALASAEVVALEKAAGPYRCAARAR